MATQRRADGGGGIEESAQSGAQNWELCSSDFKIRNPINVGLSIEITG